MIEAQDSDPVLPAQSGLMLLIQSGCFLSSGLAASQAWLAVNEATLGVKLATDVRYGDALCTGHFAACLQEESNSLPSSVY